MPSTVTSVTQERNIPDEMRALSALDQIDYADVFTATTTVAGTPEQWARAVVERAAGAQGQFVWRRLLGLRLEDRFSPQCVGGWRIGGKGENWLRLEASSWFFTARIVVRVEGNRVSVATFGRYEHTLGRLIWLPLSGIHLRAVPGLLWSAGKHMASQELST